MTTRPTAYVVHAMPGRVRVRVPARKGDGAFFDGIAGRLRQLPAVTSVTTSPLTGSVLVHFTGEIEALAFGAMTLLHDVAFELTPPPAEPMMQRVRSGLADVDATVRELSGGEMDTRALAFCGLLAISAVQLLRGNVLAPAATMLWYGAEIARHWSPGQPGAGAPMPPSRS